MRQSNLTISDPNTTAIQINVDNVTIDLNGFAIVVCSSVSIFTGNVFAVNAGVGLSATGPARYSDNLFDGNNGGNGNQQVLGGTQAGTSTCAGAACP
jgi:hypothetical protein